MGPWASSWAEVALSILLPRTCAHCRHDLPEPLSGPLCGPCLGALRPLAGPVCRRCGAPWEGPEACCPPCRGRLHSVDVIRAAFPYRPPLPRLVHAFKYRGLESAGRALADWLAGALPRWPELLPVDAVVPVPLHPARERERGFNQALTLARAAARAARAPLLEALRRRADTAPQWRFGRGTRSRRLEGSFAAALPVQGMSLLLVDDVCTSGGTLEACGTALREAGAAQVRAFALARG